MGRLSEYSPDELEAMGLVAETEAEFLGLDPDADWWDGIHDYVGEELAEDE